MSDASVDGRIIERYCVPMPDAFERASSQLVEQYPGRIERYELCRNHLNDRFYGFRLGHGSRNVVLLGAVRGREAAGTCGLLAIRRR
jgi:hypothetical protein